MAEVTAVEGVALAYVEREYGSFLNRQTGEMVPGGVTRTLWLGKGFGEEPLQVRVPEAQAENVQGLQRGVELLCHCELYANNNRLSYRLVSVEPKRASGRSAAHSAA